VKLPPYAEAMGRSILAQPDGAAPHILMPYREALRGRPGFLHGGAIGGLLEVAAIVALNHVLEGDGTPPSRMKAINVTVDYMRGGRPVSTYARGMVERLGNRIANVEAIAWQTEPGTPIASARINFLIAKVPG
jgi:uncharacterized protein (TIGR00369 family)